MKIKNIGKVHPSPSSSPYEGYLSFLKLLPAAILALASALSTEDREVLAYLITHSIKTTTTATPNPSSSSIIQKKSSKKTANGGSTGNTNNHRPPVFDCDCFDCYMSYWFRWDSSPNRELIHQVIEAFEDHLTSGESEKSKKNGKGKRRDKTARCFSDNSKLVDVTSMPEKQDELIEDASSSRVVVAEALSGSDVMLVQPISSPEKDAAAAAGAEENEVAEVSGESTAVVEEASPDPRTSAAGTSGCSTHKGLARKVLPDVLGLLNSRLWSLWSPNV